MLNCEKALEIVSLIVNENWCERSYWHWFSLQTLHCSGKFVNVVELERFGWHGFGVMVR